MPVIGLFLSIMNMTDLAFATGKTTKTRVKLPRRMKTFKKFNIK